MIEPYYADETATIYHGDCLDTIDALGAEVTVDAVVTDPPFASGTRHEASKSSSGAMLRAGRFSERPIDLDQMTSTGFVWLLRAVARGVYPLLVDGGSFLSFIGFRSQHELICHASKGVPTIYDKGISNVLRHSRVEPVDHPSPKPVPLMGRLIEAVTPPGGMVLDPFMGSGTTLRAAATSGRQAIGIEVDERYCEIAAKRLAQGVLAL